MLPHVSHSTHCCPAHTVALGTVVHRCNPPSSPVTAAREEKAKLREEQLKKRQEERDEAQKAALEAQAARKVSSHVHACAVSTSQTVPTVLHVRRLCCNRDIWSIHPW